VVGLVATGRREQAAGKLARALECWNRALAIEPDNADVLRALHRIEGRRRLYHGAVALGGSALIGGLIWGAFHIAHQEVPGPIAALGGKRVEKAKQAVVEKAKQAAAARDPSKAGTPTPAGGKRPPRTDKKQPPKTQARNAPATPSPRPIPSVPTAVATIRPDQDEARSPLPALARPKVKTFTVAPDPLGSEVWLDGRRVLKVDIGKRTFEVPWDREHLVEVRNDACCDPMPFRVGPDSPKVQDDRLIAPLLRKPAKLRVVLAPPPHVPVQMDYVVLDRPGAAHTPFAPGEELFISFDATSKLGKSLLISVYLDGKTVPVRQKVDLKPGENKALEVRLPE
jgi:hypothetical protein